MNSTRSNRKKFEEYKGCAILICSTDRKFLDDYRTLALSLGLTPVTATSPEAAVAILRVMIVAYVLLDAQDGLEACRQVMHDARETQHEAPVLVVSGKSNPNFRDQAASMGAADYLEQPDFPDDVIQALLLSSRREERAVS